MSRVHDMGGRFGDGPVMPEAEDVKFKEDWHSKALALTLACGFLGQWNIDRSRHAREGLAPTDYALFSYYEKWLAGLADILVATGLLTEDELATGEVTPSEFSGKMVPASKVAEVLSKGGPADRPSDVAPAFGPGTKVRTRKLAMNHIVDGGHTRLPGYAAGMVGEIVLYHGTHVLPDASAHGLGDQAEPLYAVAFSAQELWAKPEHAGDEVVIDLWQSYLEPAS